MAAMMRVAVLALVGGCFIEPGEPSVAPWHLVQSVDTIGGPVAFSTVQPNDLIVVAPQVMASTAIAMVTDSQGNVYQNVAKARVTDGLHDGIDFYYTIAASAGIDQLDIDGTYEAVCAWDFSGIATADSVDAATALASPGSDPGTSPPITTTHSGDLVLAAIVASGAFTRSADSTFVTDCGENGDLWSHMVDINAPAGTYTAHWIGDSLPYVSIAVAFSLP